MKKTWIILPAYNEEKYISHVLSRVKKVTKNIIVVDDGSHDKTVSFAKKYTKNVLVHQINLGKGAALKTGCLFAFGHLGADSVIFFDSDDQHNPELLPEFARKLKNNDIVFGVRSFDNKMPLLKIFLNRLASVLVLLFFGQYIPDIPSGYKGLTKNAFKKINWRAKDYAVEMEIAARSAQYRLKYETISIPTIYHDLDRGMSFLDTFTIVIQLISWRFFK